MDVKIIKDLSVSTTPKSSTTSLETGSLWSYRGVPVVISYQGSKCNSYNGLILNPEGYPVCTVKTSKNNLRPIDNQEWSTEYGCKLIKWYYNTYCNSRYPWALENNTNFYKV